MDDQAAPADQFANVAARMTAAGEAAGYALNMRASEAEALNAIGAVHRADADLVLHRQHGVAGRLCLLDAGEAVFAKHRRGERTVFARIATPFVPLGLSGMNSPGRYMSEVMLTAGSTYFGFELEKWWRLVYTHPSFGARLMALVLAHGTQLLWSTRGLEAVFAERGISHPVGGAAPNHDPDTIQRIAEGGFFAPLGEDRLNDLLDCAEFCLYSKGEVITVEGAPSDGVYVLHYGRVEARYHAMRDGELAELSRSIVRPGVALSWTAGIAELPAPYTLTATRDSTMLKISKASLARMMLDDPMLAVALLQRQAWQLGRYQQTASGLSTYAAETEADLLEALLEDNASKIPVQSVLHGAAHALRNRFTRGYALDSIYQAVITGNDTERSIAGLVMDALSGIEREHRFFGQLNTVYARVAGSPRGTSQQAIRDLSNADFDRAFDQVPYVIQGMEHLPDDPRNIFFYNHLATSPTTRLANGHIFAIDSHFVSVKILLARYGDSGKRIVRVGKSTEFTHQNYYSRLDNIFVHTPESELIAESQDEKDWRKEQFFIEAQKVFDAGRPLAIAPEGTASTKDAYTPRSPGTFKPGAFLLAARLKPEPLLVPIALANFDAPVSRATFAAVIKPPFRIADYVEDAGNRKEMKAFLDRYRKTFRSYVEEARDLAVDVQRHGARLEGLRTNVGLVSPVEEEFESDIRAVELKVIEQAQKSGRTVLYGSSTFRLWQSAQADLSDPHLMNLGFGGATLPACRAFFDRVVAPHNPDRLIFYAGDNDVGGGATPEQVLEEFRMFAGQVAERLPHARCYVVSIKASPFRANFLPVILAANRLIADFANAHPQWRYIDFTSHLLESNGAPSSMFYDDDPLHVNLAGYGLLAKLIRDTLAASEG